MPAYQQDRPKAKVTIALHGLRLTWARSGISGPRCARGLTWSSPAPANRTPTASWWCPSTTGAKRWKEWGDYYPSGLANLTWKDTPYGVPAKLDARSMVYRQRPFQKQGLKLPETWDEMRQAVVVNLDQAN